MEPNIRQLYDNLASMEMLDVKEVPFEQFATKLTDPARQKQLYDRLAGMPIEGSPYGAAGLAESDFMEKFFSKKKVQSTPGSPAPSMDFSTGSFGPDASAPTATESSSFEGAPTFEPTFAPDPVVSMPRPQAPGGDALPSNLIPRPATQDALRPAPVIDQGPVVEYSIKGDEDVRQYAASAPKNRTTKEKIESQEATMATPMTEGVESVAKAALIYAEDARRQSDIAASVLEGAYGKDWRNNPAAKQDEYYQKFTAGLTAQGRAFDEYNVATGGYSLTGEEDPVEFGETRRANLPSYEYKRKYDSRTPLRGEKRKLDNIAEYGAAANAQQKFATQFINAKYGEGWMDKMAEIAGLAESNPEIMTEELVAQYSVIAEDPMFDTWKSSLAAQEKGFEAFKAQVEASPKYKEQILKAADAQAKSDMAQAMYGGPEILAQFAGTTATGQTENRAGNWVLRKAAQLAGAALSLPRTVGKAFSGDSGEWIFADEMGSIGDELVDQAEVNYPKPSQLGRPLYEKVAEFEGREIVFDSKGKVVSISGGDTPEGFEQRLKDADLASTAKTRFNGATAVTDKVLDAGADLLIYRFLGNGTKIGTASASFYMNHQAAYQEAAKELKMGADDAAQFAFVSSALMGALEAYVGDIETALAKPGIARAVQLGRKEALAAAGSMSAAQRAVVSLKPVIKQIAGENSEEILQSVGDGAVRIAYNTMTGAELENGMSKDELKETVLVTTLLTAPLAAFGMGGHTETYRRQALLAAAKSPKKFAETLAELEKNGAIAADQVARATENINRLSALNASLPPTMSDDKRSHALALQEFSDKRTKDAAQPGVVPAMAAIAREEAKEADAVIADMVRSEKKNPTPEPAPVPVKRQPKVKKVSEVSVTPETAPDVAKERTSFVFAEAVAALEDKGMTVTPEMVPEIQEFFVETVTKTPIPSEQAVPLNERVSALAEEFMEENGVTPITKNNKANEVSQNQTKPGASSNTIRQDPTKKTEQDRVSETARNNQRRSETRGQLVALRDQGVLVTADKSLLAKGKRALGIETAKVKMTDAEIDAQMSLLDAMSNTWKEATGNDTFYDTFLEGVQKGDLDALTARGGALFQAETGMFPSESAPMPAAPNTKVTLAVFSMPQFAKMKGTMVSPQSVSDLMKGNGKQIEKDIIARVLEYEKFAGQKRISFDEFKNAVEMEVMKLEPLETGSYATYGMDNLGGDYGDATTVIFNAPIDHGQAGHFSGDFNTRQTGATTWELKQIPGTETWAAVDRNMPPGVTADNLQDYVGTAGPRSVVEAWIAQRTSDGASDKDINKGLFGHIRTWFDNATMYLAEMQSDFFQKNKASDALLGKPPDGEVSRVRNQAMRPFNQETSKAIIDITGIRVVEEENDIVVYTKSGVEIVRNKIEPNTYPGLERGEHERSGAIVRAFSILRTPYDHGFSPATDEEVITLHGEEVGWFASEKEDRVLDDSPFWSDLSPEEAQVLRDSIKETLEDESIPTYRLKNVVLRKIRYVLNEKYGIPEATYKKVQDDYYAKINGKNGVEAQVQEFINKWTSEQKPDLVTMQFVASQKVHETRLLREAIRHAASKGATKMRFPSPFTIAVIEGYVNAEGGDGGLPYEIPGGGRDDLSAGDKIILHGDSYIVVEADQYNIKVAPESSVYIYDEDDLYLGEIDSKIEDLDYTIGRAFAWSSKITRDELDALDTDHDHFLEKAKEKLEELFADDRVDDDGNVDFEDVRDDIEEEIRNSVYEESVYDLVSESDVYIDGSRIYGVEGGLETLSQPDQYEEESATEEDFEDNLDKTQQTVVDKYKEVAKIFKKMRPDATPVTDHNGREWLETEITPEDAVNPVVAFQKEGGKAKAAVDFVNETKAIVHIFDGADISSLAHEIGGHIGRRMLEKMAEQNPAFAKDYEAAKKWAGVKGNNWTVKAEEKFARGFERYLREGKAPSTALENVFGKLKDWLSNIYKAIKGSSIDVDLTPEVRKAFDAILAGRPVQEQRVEPTASNETLEEAKQMGLTPKEAVVYGKELPRIEAAVAALSLEDVAAGEAFVEEMGGDIDRVIASVNGSIEEMDRQAFEKLKETNPTVHELFFNELSEEAPQSVAVPDSGKSQEKKPRSQASRQTPTVNPGVVPTQTQGGTPAGTSNAARTAEPDPGVELPTAVTPEGVALAREIDAITPAQAEAALAGDEVAGAKVLAAAEQIEQAAEQDAALEDHNVAAETAEQIEQRIASVGKAVLVTYGDSVIVTRYEGIEDVLRDMGGVFNPSRGWTFPLSRRAEVALAISRARNPILKETAEMSKGAHGQRTVANAHDTKSHVAAGKRKAAIAKGETMQERVATAKELLEVSENEREKRVMKTVERLRKAFPGVEVVTDAAEVAAALSSMGLDSSVKGFVKDGVVYINLESAGVDTPLHEFGHVWSAVMKAKKPKLYERGIESIRGSEYEQAVREDDRYNKMEDEDILDEALATAIGERGARFQDDGPWQTFKKFLGSMKSAIKGLVGFDPMKMTANEYADMIAAQLLSGNEIMEETSAEIAKLEGDVMFQYGVSEAKDQAEADLSGATRLETLGYGAKAIRAITSWTRGPEGIWRFRPDRDAVKVVAQPNLMEDGDTLPLDRVIASDALYSVDPALRSIPVTFKSMDSEEPAIVTQAGITVNLNQVKSAAALQRAIVPQIKEMALDRIGEGDMPAVEDIGASERTVIMGEENAHAKAEVPGFQGVDLPKGARFQFGTQTVRDAAVRAAAKQLVEIELREGSVDKAAAVPFIAKELGLSEPLVDAMWDEAATRMKKSADWLDIREGKIPGILDRMKKKWGRTWARWMGPNKGLPKGIFKEAVKMEREVAAAMYSASKVAADLDRALKGHPDAVRALAQQAIEGTAEFDHLPAEVAIHAKAMRNMVDALSRKLLLSGAVKKGTIVTIMEGMGVEIAPDATGQIEEIEAVLGKMPSERSPEEVDMVNDFLDQHQQKFGTYMNRSYRAHVYPDWEKRVAPEVVDRARRYFIRELQAEYNDLAEKLGKSKAKATAKLAKLEAELDAAKSVAQALATDLELADPTDLAAIDRAKSIQDEMSAITGMSKEDVAALAAVTDTDVLAAAVSQARAIKAAMLKVQDKIDQDDVKVGKRLDEVSGKLANIDDEINAILYRQHDGSEGISSVMGGAKNLSLFIKRKDLSPEILELLGEYRDPTVNFMASVMKMSNVLASQEFLNTMASRYKGVYFFDSSQKPPGNFAQLEAAGAPHLTPLDGWWTTPDILESLKDMREPAVMAPIEKWLVSQVVQRVKLGKTILSPITHARNFWGNTAFMVLNGWNPKSMFDAYVEMAPKFNAGDPTKWRTYAEKLHRLGVLGESVNAGDLETLRKMSGWKPDSGEISDHAKFIEKYILKAPKAIFDASKSAYQAEDNFYRVLAFENEKKRYAKAWFGQSFDTLDAQQQSEIEERAAHIVSHVLPTYSYVPKLVKLIQRLPFIGTFVAFPAEATRVAYNNIQLGIEEMKDPRTASMGLRRLAGATLVHAAEIGIIKAAMAAFGYDDEEWKDAEFFVAPFEKTGGLMPLPKDEKGLMGYINLSYTNPYGFLPKMFRAYQAEPKRPMAGNVAAMLGQFSEPFLSPDLTFQTFNQLFMNQDDWGRSIRSKLFEDEMFGTNWLAKENLKSQLGFMAKKLQPGILKSGRDALDIYQQNASPSGKVKNWQNFTISHLFGLSVQRIDPTVSYKNQMYSLNVQKQEARRVYSAVQKRMNVTFNALKDDATKETMDRKDLEAKLLLKENYAVAKVAYAKVLLEAHEVTMALQRLGKTPAECRKELTGWSNREKDAILSGKIDIPLTFERKGKY